MWKRRLARIWYCLLGSLAAFGKDKCTGNWFDRPPCVDFSTRATRTIFSVAVRQQKKKTRRARNYLCGGLYFLLFLILSVFVKVWLVQFVVLEPLPIGSKIALGILRKMYKIGPRVPQESQHRSKGVLPRGFENQLGKQMQKARPPQTNGSKMGALIWNVGVFSVAFQDLFQHQFL